MILPTGYNLNYSFYNKKGQSRYGSAPSFGAINNFAYKMIDVNSADYIEYVYKLIRKRCKFPIEINVESGKLLDIAKSLEPAIFIMNHTIHQSKDAQAAKFFNTLLYREYLYNGSAKTCPRSKVLANINILNKQSDKGEQYRWFGVTPVEVGFDTKNNKQKNSETLKKLTQEFIDNKINLFIFPEGTLATLFFLPMEYKFQPGVSSIIKKVLEKKEKVKVIPLGFAHNKKGSAVHIGDSIYFTKKDGEYFAEGGSLDSKYFDKNLKRQYKDGKLLLSESGKAAGYNNVVPYISGVLVKNLECTVKEAKHDLKHSSSEVFQI